MMFSPMSPDRVDEIVIIHSASFPNSFLTELGASFLTTYFKACIKNRDTISVCAINHREKIIGYCIGSKKSKGYHKSLLFNSPIRFMIIAVILLCSRPKSLLRLMKNLEKIENRIDDGNYAELHSIAVDPKVGRRGIGGKLLTQFEHSAKLSGCEKIALTTDKLENESVLAFYRKAGYELYYELATYPQRIMLKLIKNLD